MFERVQARMTHLQVQWPHACVALIARGLSKQDVHITLSFYVTFFLRGHRLSVFFGSLRPAAIMPHVLQEAV